MPRFLCKTCGKTFSRQTFRADYRDKKPYMNVRVVEFLMAGVGLRKTARTIGMSLRGLELKWRKIAMHGRRLDLHLKASRPLKNAPQPA